jgi:hypothetical protein
MFPKTHQNKHQKHDHDDTTEVEETTKIMMTSCRCGHNLSSFRNVPPLPELDASFVHLVQEETSVVKPTEILLKIVTQGSDDHWLCGECLER